MTENNNPKVDTKALFDVKRASTYAAKTLLPGNAKDSQINIVAEKIAVGAFSQMIAEGKFQLPDRPKSHADAVEASRDGQSAQLG